MAKAGPLAICNGEALLRSRRLTDRSIDKAREHAEDSVRRRVLERLAHPVAGVDGPKHSRVIVAIRGARRIEGEVVDGQRVAEGAFDDAESFREQHGELTMLRRPEVARSHAPPGEFALTELVDVAELAQRERQRIPLAELRVWAHNV